MRRFDPLFGFALAALAVMATVEVAMSTLTSFDSCRIHLNDGHPARESFACHLYAALGFGSAVLFLAALVLLVIAGVAWLHRRLTTPRG
jgi:hypothetical protein